MTKDSVDVAQHVEMLFPNRPATSRLLASAAPSKPYMPMRCVS